MNRAVSLAILIVGVILLMFGLNAHDSIVSSAQEAVTGTPTDRSIWLIVLGAVGIVIGGLGTLVRRDGN